MKISVMGAGYVGLITGACLAKLGNQVLIIDNDKEKIEKLEKREAPFYEEGLEELLSRVKIDVSSDYRRITSSDLILLCVGTPSDENNNVVLDYLINAANQIAEVLKTRNGYCVVTVRSTVPPGTTEEKIIPVLEKSGLKVGHDFGVCMSPEFLREGKSIHDFMNPYRIVIGEYDKKSGDVLQKIFKILNAPIIRVNLRTAEMIKLASNCFLACRVSLINEFGNICKQLGIDVYEVAQGMGLDERIGSQFLSAGIGFGGSCFPKDLKMIIAQARELGYDPKIIKDALILNDEQPLRLVEILKKHVSLKNTSIGLLGLAFKPGTDDVRDSRAIKIVETLLQEGAIIKAYDPLAVENFRKLFPQIEYVNKEKVLDCDAILIVTEWDEFNDIDYRGKIVIDGRKIPKATEAKIYEGMCW